MCESTEFVVEEFESPERVGDFEAGQNVFVCYDKEPGDPWHAATILNYQGNDMYEIKYSEYNDTDVVMRQKIRTTDEHVPHMMPKSSYVFCQKTDGSAVDSFSSI